MFDLRRDLIIQDGLELMVLLPLYPKCWHYKHLPLCLGKNVNPLHADYVFWKNKITKLYCVYGIRKTRTALLENSGLAFRYSICSRPRTWWPFLISKSWLDDTQFSSMTEVLPSLVIIWSAFTQQQNYTREMTSRELLLVPYGLVRT